MIWFALKSLTALCIHIFILSYRFCLRLSEIRTHLRPYYNDPKNKPQLLSLNFARRAKHDLTLTHAHIVIFNTFYSTID